MNFKYFALYSENMTKQRCSENDICILMQFCSAICMFCLYFHFNFAPSVTGDYIPDHRWLYLLLVFSETLEIREATYLIFSYPIKAFLEFIILFYFILFQQTEEFLLGRHS